MLLFAACLLAGCGGASRFGNVEQELAEYAGKMTMEDAVDRWGEPTSVSEGELLTVAYWERKRSSGMVTERLYLTFDNNTKKLKAYRYYEKPFD
jgi:hypothetical protein